MTRNFTASIFLIVLTSLVSCQKKEPQLPQSTSQANQQSTEANPLLQKGDLQIEKDGKPLTAQQLNELQNEKAMEDPVVQWTWQVGSVENIRRQGEAHLSMWNGTSAELKPSVKPLLQNTLSLEKQKLEKCKAIGKCNPAYVDELQKMIQNLEAALGQ